MYILITLHLQLTLALNTNQNANRPLDKWLTPKKTQVFWPPTKDTKTFDKLLQQCSSPNERWSTYGIDRVFCETNELDKARKKLKLVEFTSDIQTEDETEMSKPSKRKIKKNNRYVSSDEDDVNENYLSRPPPLKKPLNSYLNSPRLGETNSGLQIPQSTNTTEIINTTTTVIENNSEPPGSPGLDCSSLTESLPICKNSKCGFQDKVVSLLAHIKAQNDIIMSILQEKGNIKPKELNPEFKFPLETFEDLETAEQLLDEKEHRDNLVAYFKSLGGKGPNGKVSRVMKVALSDSMASKFNFFGKRSDKKAFAELSLRKSIVESLKSPETTEKDIEDSIKIWLKHAPERAKKRLSKQST